MTEFYIAIALAVLGSTAYHIFQKSIPSEANPALVLAVTYTIAFSGSLLLFFFFPLKESLGVELGHFNLTSFLPGVAILGIEIGFLLAYRGGGNINVASLSVNMMVALLLVPVGLLFYKETLSAVKVVGIIACLIGLVLISLK